MINHKDINRSISKSFLCKYQVSTSSKATGFHNFSKVADLSTFQEDGFVVDSKIVVEVFFQFQHTPTSKFVTVGCLFYHAHVQLALENQDQKYNIDGEFVERESDNNFLDWLLTKQFIPDGNALIVKFNQPESVIQLNISKLSAPLDMLFMDRHLQIVSIFKSVYWANVKSTKPASYVVIFQVQKLYCQNNLQAQTVDRLQLTCDFQASLI